MRICCAQFQGAPGDPARNIARMADLARQAREKEAADLVVFPEMAISAYGPVDVLQAHAQGLDGDHVGAMAEIAGNCAVDLAFGMAERYEDGRLYNTMVYIDLEGRTLAAYRKTHLFGPERDWATPGPGAATFQTRFGPTTMWICYDTRFPELARAAAVRGARLALVSTAWFGPPEEWDLALRARALDNGIFVAGADQISDREGLVCRGLSRIAGPHGDLRAAARPGEEGLIVAEIDLEDCRCFYDRVPVLEHRRDDIL